MSSFLTARKQLQPLLLTHESYQDLIKVSNQQTSLLFRVKTQEGGVVLSGGWRICLWDEGKTLMLRYKSPRKSWMLYQEHF